MEKLKKELKEKNFLNENDSNKNHLSISFMEDYIALYNTIEDAMDKLNFNNLDDEEFTKSMQAQCEHMKKLFKEGKKIIHYCEWGKVIKEKWIRELLWEFFDRNPEYVLLFENSDSGSIILQDKNYWFNTNYGISEFGIDSCVDIQKMRKYDWVFEDL